MLNVLHLAKHLGCGGTEKYIFMLAKKLNGGPCKFSLAYSEDGGGKRLFEDAGIDLYRLEMRNPLDVKAANELKALCGMLSTDVLHTHFLRENYIAAISRIFGNRAGIINTRHVLFENTGAVIAANRFFTMFNDKIIAVSKSVKERLEKEGIKPDKIALIYNGVDTGEWNAAVQPTFREDSGIPADVVLVSSVARFSEEKGHEFFIDAIKYFKDHMHEYGIIPGNVKFVLAGDGELRAEIEEKAKNSGLLGDIIFTGYRTDIKNILKSSDIYVSHSKSEAMPISILEAMAAGIPVISTDSSGALEILNSPAGNSGSPEAASGQTVSGSAPEETTAERHGNGILVRYGDKKAFSDNLARLVRNGELRKIYAANARKAVREYFSLDKMAEDTYNLYKTIKRQ